jgi:hypothetical protein
MFPDLICWGKVDSLRANWRVIKQFQARNISSTITLHGIPEDYLSGEPRMRGKKWKIKPYLRRQETTGSTD